MPNWCSNELVVDGDPQELERFAAHVRGHDNGQPLALSFEAILPTPRERLLDGGWYDWRVSHWGSKWELDPDQLWLEQQPDRLIYWFLSAWAPPLPLLALLAGRFPTLQLGVRYAEPGVALAGAARFAGGVCISAEETCWQWQQALETLSRHWPSEAAAWADLAAVTAEPSL